MSYENKKINLEQYFKNPKNRVTAAEWNQIFGSIETQTNHHDDSIESIWDAMVTSTNLEDIVDNFLNTKYHFPLFNNLQDANDTDLPEGSFALIITNEGED